MNCILSSAFVGWCIDSKNIARLERQ